MKGSGAPRYYGYVKVIDPANFKKIRGRAQLTQEKLAGLALVEPKVIQRAEQGQNITKDHALAIAKALRRPIGELFFDAFAAGDEVEVRSKPAIGAVNFDEGRDSRRSQYDSRSTTLEESRSLTIAEAEEAIASTEVLYEYAGGRVSAIRLYGAAEQCLAPTQIKVKYQDSQFPIPKELKDRGEERIRELIARRDRGEIELFDGPCARLLRWVKPSFESFAQDGRRHLELHVGPMGWYDMERTNGVLRQDLLKGIPINYEHWIGLSTLAHQGKVEESKLTNIAGNAVTIFTRDGQVGYQQRGELQSSGSKQLSSAVAENLHRYFDDTEPGNPFKVFHPLLSDQKVSDGPNNEECPPVSGELHPAAAVMRGINEETSYVMTEHVPEDGLKCTGLCFSLDALQPDLLWIVLVDRTAEQFTKLCRMKHGRDWREGRVRFVSPDFADIETQRVPPIPLSRRGYGRCESRNGSAPRGGLPLAQYWAEK